MNVKIIGAGSIGNHLAQAARRMGWDVVVVDRDQAALDRMKNDIYPKRYGAWDPAIRLCTTDQEPKGGFDVICIGTPPDVHMTIAREALKEDPKVLQLEKPLCTPGLQGLKEFTEELKKHPNTKVIVGYDHAVSEGIEEVIRVIDSGLIGQVETVDVEFRLHWKGIFLAHPWLSGPEDTYLGYWERGGGASGEHSHSLHLWQLLAERSGLGKWKQVSTLMEMKKAGKAEYDSIAAFSFVTDKGKVGRVVQDVVTWPIRQWARVQGDRGYVEWLCNGHATGDIVRFAPQDGEIQEKILPKTRPDDFYREMVHIEELLSGKMSIEQSPLSLQTGIEVMQVVATAHKYRNQVAEIEDFFTK